MVWRGTAEEKAAHLTALTQIDPANLPHVTVGEGEARTTRYFPERLPIGIHLAGRGVLVYVVTDPWLDEFRVFLERHAAVLRALPAWTLRIAVPPHFPEIGQRAKQVVWNQLLTPLKPATLEELRWFFDQVRTHPTPSRCHDLDERFYKARDAFGFQLGAESTDVVLFRDKSEVATIVVVVMAAKWPGKCRRCGKPIPPGSPMDWTKEGGALHLSPEECERAGSAAPLALRGPAPEDPEERMLIVELLLGHPWKSATSKRYEKLPHQYSLRRHWDDESFVRAVTYTRRVGYEQQFIGRVWIYYDIGEFQYWDCGGPVSGVGLINRAVRRPA